jgi:hypothetical protein
MKETIRNWMTNTINDGSWKKYNDLHIDKISSKYNNKSMWVNGAIESLKNAIIIRIYFSLLYTIK